MNLAAPSLDDAIAYVKRRAPRIPQIALVLGSGLGDFADTLADPIFMPTSEIPGYPLSTVEGHKGRIVFGKAGDRDVLAFQGRVHFYECGDLIKVLSPVRLAYGLGARILVVTNAAGGVNRQLSPGDLMLITDLINLTGEIPSQPDGRMLERKEPFDQALREQANAIARQLGIPLQKGVYAGVKGPSYETAAEVEMIHRLGGDAVGMSTVIEVQLAALLGMRVLGISCITNKGTGIGTEKLSHKEVNEVAGRVKKDFTRFLDALIRAL